MTGPVDVAVIGGGFYGTAIAADLGARGRSVVLLEQDDRLLARASTLNQARVHGGYHYPRSVATGLSSRRNYQRFTTEFADAVVAPVTSLYAIARTGSWTTAAQFELFCRRIEAPCRPAGEPWRSLFSRSMVSEVFEVQEAVFDAAAIARTMERRLAGAGVDVWLGTEVVALHPGPDAMSVETAEGAAVVARQVVNCTYWRLNEFCCGGPRMHLQHEWAEIAMCRPPEVLRDVAVTMIDGPFFSLLPFPPGGSGVSTLSHVRYTPHARWTDDDPGAAAIAATAPTRPRFGSMLRDSARYLPTLASTTHEQSAFEVKTVPADRDGDDGRPIVFSTAPESAPRVASVLGSKLDLVYDVLPRVESFVADVEVLAGR